MWWSEGGVAHEHEDLLLILTLLDGLRYTQEACARALHAKSASIPAQGWLSRKRIVTRGQVSAMARAGDGYFLDRTSEKGKDVLINGRIERHSTLRKQS